MSADSGIVAEVDIVWTGAPIYAEGITYIPYATEQGQVGYAVRSATGAQEEYLYLNPSIGTDDGKPNVFLYQGTTAEPMNDDALQHFLVARDFEANPTHKRGADLRDGDTVYVDGEWLKLENVRLSIESNDVIEAFCGSRAIYFAMDGNYQTR